MERIRWWNERSVSTSTDHTACVIICSCGVPCVQGAGFDLCRNSTRKSPLRGFYVPGGCTRWVHVRFSARSHVAGRRGRNPRDDTTTTNASHTLYLYRFDTFVCIQFFCETHKSTRTQSAKDMHTQVTQHNAHTLLKMCIGSCMARLSIFGPREYATFMMRDADIL